MCSESLAISVQNVSKCFRIYNHPSDRLKQLFTYSLKNLFIKEKKFYSEFWALHNITFEVEKGKTVGVLGQNGSGKSTLLQLICGTMSPTSGEIKTTGQIAALLELGSGFNPEFTGIENVYLNASLLGLSKTQTENKLDQILAFADIGEFVYQPVKTYSSGMMLRLAFATQVALDTEILIIDEALAVGDARFQLKCFKRLKQLKEAGTTIFFVSHDIQTIRSFCDLGLVLDKGKSLFWGDTVAATTKYYSTIFPDKNISTQNKQKSEEKLLKVEEESGTMLIDPSLGGCQTFGVGGAKLECIKIKEVLGKNTIKSGQKIRITCSYSWDQAFVREIINKEDLDYDIGVGLAVSNIKGEYLFGCNTYDTKLVVNPFDKAFATVEFNIQLPEIRPGDYFITCAISVGKQSHHVQLQWYEHLADLKLIPSNREVFGIVAVEYGAQYA